MNTMVQPGIDPALLVAQAERSSDNCMRFNWALPLLTGSIDDTAERRAMALALALANGLDGVDAVDVAIAATAPELLVATVSTLAATQYQSFCALRDARKHGSEAPTYTEAQAFNLALLQHAAPHTKVVPPQEEKTMEPIDLFVTTPLITLPSGAVVQPFQVAQYLTGSASNRPPVITADATPCVEISYFGAQELAGQMGYKLITELQYLAIAHDIAGQGINWTGGKVGEGDIYQGLHLGEVGEPQPGNYVSDEPSERRWHQLSNGVRLYDFAGNAYSWVFDDVQGDERGLVAKPFAKDSPSITTAPHASMTKGMGWRPRAGSDWSGRALVRGGYWHGGDGAGVFLLLGGSPDDRDDRVGFRCTK